MIPRKLELKNFLCYADNVQTINFKDYNLICLSGKNGYGKSALLDAMTWALWGQARKTSGTSKPDAGLLRLGQTRMVVCFEYEVGDKQYRIRREYSKTYGKPYSALDFEVYEEKSGTFRSLTDKTIRETQAKIEQTIGLDFDTFINTAFLKQGQSNEFSKKTSKERKQILSNILGLSKYDTLQQQALEIVRRKDTEKKVCIKLQEQYKQELDTQQQLEKKLVVQKDTLAKKQRMLEHFSKQQQSLDEKKQKYLQKQQQQQELTQSIQSLNKEIIVKQQELSNTRLAWKKTHSKLLNVADKVKLEQEKKQIFEKMQNLVKAKQSILHIQEQLLKKKERYQQAITAYQQKYEKTLYSLKITLEKKELKKQYLNQQYNQQKKDIQKITESISDIDKQILTKEALLKKNQINITNFEKIKKQFDKRRTFYQILVQQGNYIKNNLDNLYKKKTIIHDVESPSCPLCQQILTTKRRIFLNKQFNNEESFSTHRLNRITKVLTRLKQVLIEQHKQVEKLTQKQQTIRQLTLHIEELKKKKPEEQAILQKLQQEQNSLARQYKKIEETLATDKKKLTEQQKSLKNKQQKDHAIKALHQHIEQIKKQKQAISFDQKLYNDLQIKAQKIEQAIQQAATIDEEKRQQLVRKVNINQLCKELKKLNYVKNQKTKELEQFLRYKDREKQLQEEQKSLTQQYTEITQQKDSILQEIGKLENALDRLHTIKKKHLEQKKYLTTLTSDIEDYQNLANAFSKNGIQALLIEEAIPEIEYEANAILAKLTNNQSQIFIESLRDLKSGGVRETLDIKITDEIGIRPYEMYSGGEAFRIDFALRIAISKLLARRAGTALQTLIIDEGFGSQDEEGRHLLMNAIHLIQQYFSKVIIVSHLPEFKDNFPVHFVVNKQASGSSITVEERG